MLKSFFSILLIVSHFSWADDLLDVLDGDSKSMDGLSIEKKSNIFQSLIAKPTAEQNIFFQFLEKGETKKALYQWPSAFEGTSFASSSTGQSLYGYLLFKNGRESIPRNSFYSFLSLSLSLTIFHNKLHL